LEKNNGFPQGWVETKLDIICNSIRDGTHNPPKRTENGIPLLSAKNIQNGFIDWKENCSRISESDFKDITRNNSIEENDVLLTIVGTLGRSCVVDTTTPFTVQRSVAILKFNKEVVPTFIKYFFDSMQFQNDLKNNARGVAQVGVYLNTLKNFMIPVPPINGQKKIVEKIEELFSIIEYTKQLLKNSQIKLKQFSQSLLQKTYDELGKNYKHLTINELSLKITDGEHLKPNYTKSGIPFITAKNVREFGITFDDVNFISENDAKRFHQKCHPEENDLLIVSRGATVGRLCLVDTKQPFCLLGSVILIKPSTSIVPKFLTYFLKSPNQRKELIQLSGSTAQQAIYLRDIKGTKIPLPSLEKQKEIVSKFDDYFLFVEKSTELVKSNIQFLERTKSVILEQAFEGKLIPQNPNDESSSELLKRIKSK
jgi:type I restriction enzyme, S subunit